MLAINYDAYFEDLLAELKALVRIPSVRDEATASSEAPYGQEIRRALDYMIALAQAEGLTVQNYANEAIAIDLPGQLATPYRIDVVSHLDVVQAGSHWTRPAFEAVEEDGKLYGRGVNDMKRSCLLVFYAMKIIQDYKIPLRNQLRLVYGSDEETEMLDLEPYLRQAGQPDFAFTPDGVFPVCVGEFGAITWEFRHELAGYGPVLELSGGEGANVVPSQAQARLAGDYQELLQTYLDQKDWPGQVSYQDGETHLRLDGKGAHASEPQLGINAISRLFQTLGEALDLESFSELGRTFSPSDGSGVGIAYASPEMGALTFNLGQVDFRAQSAIKLAVDCRFPNGSHSDELKQKIQSLLPDWQIQASFDVPVTLEDADRPAIQILSKTFAQHFPEESQTPLIGKAVSYSKKVGNCISFGANFQQDPEVAHQADEYVEIDSLIPLLKLYTESLIKLGQAKEL